MVGIAIECVEGSMCPIGHHLVWSGVVSSLVVTTESGVRKQCNEELICRCFASDSQYCKQITIELLQNVLIV